VRISLIKTLSVVLFCFSFSLWTDARSMEISIEKEMHSGISICPNSGCCKSDKDCCTHWGLKRWVYGIKEYVIDRCMCCAMCGFNPIDEDRAYHHYNVFDEVESTSDCCVCSGRDYGWYNNPIIGTLCFPFATTMHLICLPVACCYPTKAISAKEKAEKDEEHKTSPLEQQEENERNMEEYRKRKRMDRMNWDVVNTDIYQNPANPLSSK
jgi:hypothetical protein